MEFGTYTFGELTPDPATGRTMSPAQRLQNLIDEAVLADQVGLDVYAIGEHHRPDFAVSAPTIVLAAAAERTRRISLSTAVTVLSSEDPVRVFQQFTTLDLLSGGRAEIMAGRGSFIESFPLFGLDLHDYDELFAEKLGLLLQLREQERITWQGKHTPSIDDRGVYPRPDREIPIWIAVGGTPESAIRTGYLGLPMALAIIGGEPARFAPIAELHRKAAREAGHTAVPALSINSHGLIADDSQAASDIAFPPTKLMMDRIGRERGWPPMSREQFEGSRELHGANFIGSPQQVVDKILYQHEIFGHQRVLVQFMVGSVAHAAVMRSIELLGTVVAPAVQKALASAG